MTESRELWRAYEAAARSVLSDLRHHFDIEAIEGEQSLPGKSQTSWAIEGKATTGILGGFLVIECRRHKRRLTQEAVGGLAFRIADLGASGGITVSPLPLQVGAKLVAASSNIVHLQLTPWSDAENYLAEFMGRTFHGVSNTFRLGVADEAEATVRPKKKPASGT